MAHRLPLVAALAVLATACGGRTSKPVAPPLSGPSPFAACLAGTSANTWVGSEYEPFVAVDPLNPDHLVAVWGQDKFRDGGSPALGAAASFDGGATWTRSWPPFGDCVAGGSLDGRARTTDPWVAFSASGTVHAAGLAYGPEAGGWATSVVTSSSPDGGLTWRPAVAIRDQLYVNGDVDKDALSAHPADAKRLYAVWDEMLTPTHAPTWFSRSTDGGATWEAPKVAFDPCATCTTFGSQALALADGSLLLFTTVSRWAPDGSFAGTTLQAVRSADDGVHWSAPVVAAPMYAGGTVARPMDPLGTIELIRDGAPLVSAAVAADGSVHLAWQSATGAGVDGIFHCRSDDGGASWSLPALVNDRTPSIAAFTPAVAVLASGQVGVSYQDLRPDTHGTPIVHSWLATSSDGVSWRPQAFGDPFDVRGAIDVPISWGVSGHVWFLGDYAGLAPSRGGFVSIRVRTTGKADDPTAVFADRLTP